MKELFLKRFLFYKDLGDKTFEQLSDDEVLWQYNAESNSIATIVQHIAGNMVSRWTNFLTEDGEKEYRNRDAEFLNDIQSKAEMIAVWENGWKVLLEAINLITDENINTPIFIRGEKHSLLDAVLRQLAHYPYHIGQIIYAAKMLKNDAWKTLSIARNKSAEYNSELLTKLNSTDIPQNSSPVCYAKSDDVRDDYKLE
ncbi:DUF1572 domain-containing protein [Kaistella sp. 97-N-M2]|uniref:DUF1572 family protein n=1 Tax=Kaistella sp. 97-N-M2 TaxID=2908645 RepID=UPI001F32BDA1|nr:DUF1572 family protein [Kaistella sp. 97-N-M2]UJF30068.1 DUF1572 domain-containing protein [Kaistella sp. 97-N-M2]